MSRLIQSNQKSQQFIDLFQYGLIMLAALSALAIALAMPITARAGH